MSLEDKLQELIDAVNKNTAVTENLTKMRSDAIEAVKGAAKPAHKEKAAVKDKPAAEEPKQNIQTDPEDRKDPADEGAASPSYDSLGDAIKSFMAMDDDAERRGARGALVKKMFGHEKIKAKKHTDVPEAMISTVIMNLENQQAKLKEEYAAEDAAKDSGGDDDDLIG